jgi:hypothetical protein
MQSDERVGHRLDLGSGQLRQDHIPGYGLRIAVERLWAAAAEAAASNGDGYVGPRRQPIKRVAAGGALAFSVEAHRIRALYRRDPCGGEIR